MRQLLTLHDRITIAGNYFAMALLFVICRSVSYEVVSRYIFNAPTLWANALVSYLLCATVFLSVPELTRRNEHVTINMLRDALPATTRIPFDAILRLVAGFMCLFAAWFCGVETLNQFDTGVETILEWQVPKWWVSIFIPYGFLNAGLYFLRHIAERPVQGEEGALA